MRFNCAIVAFMASVSFGVAAATPNEVFSANKEQILSGTCFQADGYCFGVGKVMPRSAKPNAIKAAANKAALEATANLVCRKAVASVVWPDNMAPDERQRLSQLVSGRITLTATIQGILTVYSKGDSNSVQTVVVSAPEKNLSGVPALSYAKIQQIVRQIEETKARRLAQLQAEKKERETLVQTNIVKTVVEERKTPIQTNIVETVEEEEEQLEVLPVFILPPYATGNENETIGF